MVSIQLITICKQYVKCNNTSSSKNQIKLHVAHFIDKFYNAHDGNYFGNLLDYSFKMFKLT